MSSSHFSLDWSTVGEVSGGVSASAHYRLVQASISQMSAGNSSANAHYRLCSGARCVGASLAGYAVYLPLTRR
jgi:hypothetical protein